MRTGDAGKICLNEFRFYFPSTARVAQRRYEIGLFAQGEDLCAARGHFVHVYVDKENRRPVKALPLKLKTVLETLV